MQTWLWNWAVGRNWRNFEEYDGKNLSCLKKAVSRNMNVNNSASDNSKGSEENDRKKHISPQRVPKSSLIDCWQKYGC